MKDDQLAALDLWLDEKIKSGSSLTEEEKTKAWMIAGQAALRRTEARREEIRERRLNERGPR